VRGQGCLAANQAHQVVELCRALLQLHADVKPVELVALQGQQQQQQQQQAYAVCSSSAMMHQPHRHNSAHSDAASKCTQHEAWRADSHVTLQAS